ATVRRARAGRRFKLRRELSERGRYGRDLPATRWDSVGDRAGRGAGIGAEGARAAATVRRTAKCAGRRKPDGAAAGSDSAGGASGELRAADERGADGV